MWSGLSLIVAMAPVIPAYVPLIVEISVNGTESGEAVVVLRDPGGAMFIPTASLAAHRIRLTGLTAVTLEGEAHVRLNDLPGLSAALDETTQRLALTIPAKLFEATELSFAGADQGSMTPGGTGILLNYDLLGQIGNGPTLASGAAELVIFSGSSHVYATAIAGWSKDGMRATRLDSSWTLDFPGSMRSLTIGDSISRGGVGGAPLRFAGIQFGRNFATAPGFVTLPMPTLSGSAALPSVVDIYLNNIRLDSRTIAPGPFAITEIPEAAK